MRPNASQFTNKILRTIKHTIYKLNYLCYYIIYDIIILLPSYGSSSSILRFHLAVPSCGSILYIHYTQDYPQDYPQDYLQDYPQGLSTRLSTRLSARLYVWIHIGKLHETIQIIIFVLIKLSIYLTIELSNYLTIYLTIELSNYI